MPTTSTGKTQTQATTARLSSHKVAPAPKAARAKQQQKITAEVANPHRARNCAGRNCAVPCVPR